MARPGRARLGTARPGRAQRGRAGRGKASGVEVTLHPFFWMINNLTSKAKWGQARHCGAGQGRARQGLARLGKARMCRLPCNNG